MRVKKQNDVLAAVCGMRPALLAEWLTAHGFVANGVPQHCSCKAKTAVVPAYRVGEWKTAMANSVMGMEAIQTHWRYLGVTIATRAYEDPALLNVAEWQRAPEDTAIRMTWQRHMIKMERRVQELGPRAGSPGFKARAWNTYVASCVPFPSQLCLPDKTMQKRMRSCMRSMFRLDAWCPVAFLGGIETVRG
ncbi:MAG: hypothetical protein ACKPKO_61780, partial [Candidatus Fonsibacter sp.]